MTPAFDLAEPIRAAVEATRHEARRRGLRLTLSTPARPLRIAADEAAFRADLQRRLFDALAALPDGGGLRLDVQVAGGVVHLAIGDTGWSVPLATSTAAPAATPSATAGRLAGMRVLVADDSPDAAQGLATLLRLAGAEAWAVFGGQTAIDEALRLRPHAAVLDLDMPGVDGCDAARRLRDDAAVPALRLIALTGGTRADDRQRARAAGFDHHLAKPVDIERLIAVLVS